MVGGFTVSIPHSGFWWVELHYGLAVPGHHTVSIPQSGFWWVEAAMPSMPVSKYVVSIPQSGFWWVEARAKLAMLCEQLFQSPSRDSGGLKSLIDHGDDATRGVSIPQSGFWWVEASEYAHQCTAPCSFNPPVGILVG